MMASALALPDVEIVRRIEPDCVLVKTVEVKKKPHTIKRKLHRKPLFKKDVPVDWELNCEEPEPPFTLLPPEEPDAPISVPDFAFEPPDVPVPVVPGVEAPEPCGCFGGAPPSYGAPPFGPALYTFGGPPVRPVPEPGTWVLMLAGLGLVVRRREAVGENREGAGDVV
jgi:hypothetical protein